MEITRQQHFCFIRYTKNNNNERRRKSRTWSVTLLLLAAHKRHDVRDGWLRTTSKVDTTSTTTTRRRQNQRISAKERERTNNSPISRPVFNLIYNHPSVLSIAYNIWQKSRTRHSTQTQQPIRRREVKQYAKLSSPVWWRRYTILIISSFIILFKWWLWKIFNIRFVV
jgi:hypothetical protein